MMPGLLIFLVFVSHFICTPAAQSVSDRCLWPAGQQFHVVLLPPRENAYGCVERGALGGPPLVLYMAVLVYVRLFANEPGCMCVCVCVC